MTLSGGAAAEPRRPGPEIHTAFAHEVARLDALIDELERATDLRTRATAQTLVQTIMRVHAMALAELFATLADRDPGLADTIAADVMVGSVLALHGVHPVPLATRVAQAIDRARADAQTRGASLTLIEASDDGTVRVRLGGNGAVSPSWALTLQSAVETAIREVAPEVDAIVIEDDSGRVLSAPPRPAGSAGAAAPRRAPLPLAPVGVGR